MGCDDEVEPGSHQQSVIFGTKEAGEKRDGARRRILISLPDLNLNAGLKGPPGNVNPYHSLYSTTITLYNIQTAVSYLIILKKIPRNHQREKVTSRESSLLFRRRKYLI